MGCAYSWSQFMALALPPDLSAAQAAIWLDQQLFPGKPVYNTGQVLTIRGKLRVDLFEIALRETIAESPGLRLPPWSEEVPFDLKVLDFRDEKDPLILAERWMRTEMGRVIPLEDPALFRFALLQVGDDYWLWFQNFHHIIIDATGRRLLSARTACRYRALRFGEPLSVMKAATPGELLDVEQRYMASTIYDVDRNYWHEQFARWPGPLLAHSGARLLLEDEPGVTENEMADPVGCVEAGQDWLCASTTAAGADYGHPWPAHRRHRAEPLHCACLAVR